MCVGAGRTELATASLAGIGDSGARVAERNIDIDCDAVRRTVSIVSDMAQILPARLARMRGCNSRTGRQACFFARWDSLAPRGFARRGDCAPFWIGACRRYGALVS